MITPLVAFVINATITVFSIIEQRRRAKKAKREAAARADAAKGLVIPTEGESAPLGVYYGRNMIGGARVYHNSFNSFTPAAVGAGGVEISAGMSVAISGDKHEFLAYQQALSLSNISRIATILINSKPKETAEFQYGYRYHVYLGGTIADPMIVGLDPVRSTALFTGVPYLSAVFRLNRDEPQYNGTPATQPIVDGAAVYSITGALGSRTLSASKAYTNNSALILLDYLLNEEYGRGLSVDQVDLDSFYSAAQACNRVVMTDVPKNGEYWNNTAGTRDIRLYETNIGLPSDKALRDNIEILLNPMGRAELVWSGSVYKLKLIYPLLWVAGTYQIDDIVQYEDGSGNVDLFRSKTVNATTPEVGVNWANDVISAYITDDDIVRTGDNTITWPNASNRLNFATCRFLNEAKDFVEDTVSWPPKTGLVYAAYKSEDFNVPLEGDFFESGITDHYHALAKAEERVRLSRDAVVYQFSVSANYSGLEPGDVIKVNSTVLNIPGEIMAIDEIKVKEDGVADIQATKFDARHLAWNAADDEIVAARNIYSMGLEQATGLAFVSVNPDEPLSAGQLEWNNAADSRVTHYSIRVTADTSIDLNTIWREIGYVTRANAATTSFSIPPLSLSGVNITVISMGQGRVAPQAGWPVIPITPGIITIDSEAVVLPRIYRRLGTVPATPTGGVFDFDIYALTTVPTNWSVVIPAGVNACYYSEAMAYSPDGTGVDSSLTWSTPAVFLNGEVTAVLSEPVAGVSQNSSGVNVYTAAIGRFNVYNGSVDVTESVGTTFSIVSLDGVTLTLSNAADATKGDYAVTGLTKDKGSALLRVVYNGVTIEQTLTVVLVGAGKIRDLTAPPIAAGITAVSTTTTTYITQSTPGYSQGHGHAYTEVWASASNAVGTAVKIDQFAGNNYNIPIPINVPRYMWFKWVSQDGVAGPISAASINVSSTTIQTVDLATGAVTTVKLADNAVTQGKYSTADINNLIFNPDFATGDTRSWNRVSLFGGGAIDVVPNATGGVPGGASTNNILRIAHSGNTETSITSSDGNFNTSGLVGGTPVTTGENFFVAIEAASNIAGTGLLVDIVFKTAAGAITSLTALTPNLTTGWVSYNASFQSSVTGRMYLRVGHYAGSAKTSFITNVRLYKRNTADLIVDGAIIAAKLAVNAVAAGNIQADAITSTKIAADQITATHMAVDSITAANGAIADLAVTNAKIGGALESDNYIPGDAGWMIDKNGNAEFNDATFRGTIDVVSATSGARLEIKNNVIKVFDTGGVLRVQIGDLSA